MVRLEELEQELIDEQWAKARRVRDVVNGEFAGKEYETREEKQNDVARINNVTRWNALTIICPKCGLGSNLNVASPTKEGTKTGAVQFMHSEKGKTIRHGGKKVIEELTIVPTVAIGDDGRIIPEMREKYMTGEQAIKEIAETTSDTATEETPKKKSKKPAKKKPVKKKTAKKK